MEQVPKPIFISKLIDEEFGAQLVELLKEFKDSFAWDYSEMPGLSIKLVEHKLLMDEKPLKASLRG